MKNYTINEFLITLSNILKTCSSLCFESKVFLLIEAITNSENFLNTINLLKNLYNLSFHYYYYRPFALFFRLLQPDHLHSEFCDTPESILLS